MEKLEYTDKNIMNVMYYGGKAAEMLQSNLDNMELMLFIASSKLFLETTAIQSGIDKEEFDRMFSYAESTARDLKHMADYGQ